MSSAALEKNVVVSGRVNCAGLVLNVGPRLVQFSPGRDHPDKQQQRLLVMPMIALNTLHKPLCRVAS